MRKKMCLLAGMGASLFGMFFAFIFVIITQNRTMFFVGLGFVAMLCIFFGLAGLVVYMERNKSAERA